MYIFAERSPLNSHTINTETRNQALEIARQATNIIPQTFIRLFQLLGLKRRQPLRHIRPTFRTLANPFDSLQDLVFTGTDLLRGIAVAQRERVVLDALEVDSDAQRCAQLVVARIPTIIVSMWTSS